jgi:hypothetical protein
MAVIRPAATACPGSMRFGLWHMAGFERLDAGSPHMTAGPQSADASCVFASWPRVTGGPTGIRASAAGHPAQSLLRCLGRSEAHREGDPRPGKPFGTGRPQQRRFELINFCPDGGKQGQGREKFSSVQAGSTRLPDNELSQFDCRRRLGIYPPRCTGNGIAAGVKQTLARRRQPSCL